MPKPITLEHGGRSQSVSAWARETGISINVILSRLRQAWPIIEVLTTPVGSSRTTKPVSVQAKLFEHGEKTQTLAAWATDTGLTLSTIRGRIAMGWSILDTLTKPYAPRNAHGAGQRRENMKGYKLAHKRLGYFPKPANHCCMSCSKEYTGTGVDGLQGDHDPVTGLFRGWLCFHCNTGIGKLGDTLEGVQRAEAYLIKSKVNVSI
jgi:hypothetical protein